MRLNANTFNHTETYDIETTDTFAIWCCGLPYSKTITTTADTATLTCPVCDTPQKSTRIYKVDTNVNCTNPCVFGNYSASAIEKCSCECGGKHHGTGWFRTDTEYWTPEQIAQTQRRIQKLREEQQQIAAEGRRLAEERKAEWEDFLDDIGHYSEERDDYITLREVIKWLNDNNFYSDFLSDMKHLAKRQDLNKWTNGRLNALFNAYIDASKRHQKRNEQQAELDAVRARNTPPVDGKATLTLTVLSANHKLNPYGRGDLRYRVTCMDERGWKINMSLPAKLFDYCKSITPPGDNFMDYFKGLRFTCNATISVPEHDDNRGFEYDPWFAFAKRPTKVKVL